MSAAATLVRLPAGRVVASAKINLALHVTGQRANGYHDLSSLVAFAEGGDHLSVSPAPQDAFRLTGPFAAALDALPEAENIVLKALARARIVAAGDGQDFGPLAIHLDKHLPVAAGIGGGSADAAALLALVAQAMPALADLLREEGLRLGADVPMCFDGVPAHVEGLGEIGTPLTRFPALPCLLVNSGCPVATPDVFRRLRQRSNDAMPPVPVQGFADMTSLVVYLERTRNDLETAAMEIAPKIAAVRDALHREGAAFARMSGSGATVFGLFESDEVLRRAAEALAERHPGWWVLATRLRAAERPAAASAVSR